MDKIVVFETFYNPIEASIVKQRLIDSGIQCFLTDEHTIGVNPLYNQALGGVKLHLFERDVELANQVLADQNLDVNFAYDEDGFEESAYSIKEEMKTDHVCPRCGSDNVGFVQATKNRFDIPTTLFSLLLMIHPFKANKVHHCFNCEHEF